MNSSLKQRDLNVLWHPCTQMKDHDTLLANEAILPLIPIKRGEGVWLEDFEGKRYLDAVSSWWVNLFGHANPHITQALKKQVDELEHVILAGFTHEPVVNLAEQLIAITPADLTRCFFADNGSASIEVALKMSFHFWKNTGFPEKKQFITVQDGYHGETLGALAVGDVALYKDIYAPLLMPTLTVPSPATHYAKEDETAEQVAERQITHLETLLQQQHQTIAAIVIEPLVQCAGGMKMHSPYYLQLLRQLCDRYQVHLIADEIAVGFGRTGTLFACEQAQITPDFLCLSKGLTGGFLPLSVVLTTDKIYAAFYDDYQKLNGFLHSHSYTGNPLACSAALATLEIFQQQNIIEKNKSLIASLAEALASLADHPHITNIRQCGMIGAFDLVENKQTKQSYAWQQRHGMQVYREALKRGVILRPLGNVIYLMPPYVITAEQIHWVIQVARESIDTVLKR